MWPTLHLWLRIGWRITIHSRHGDLERSRTSRGWEAEGLPALLISLMCHFSLDKQYLRGYNTELTYKSGWRMESGEAAARIRRSGSQGKRKLELKMQIAKLQIRIQKFWIPHRVRNDSDQSPSCKTKPIWSARKQHTGDSIQNEKTKPICQKSNVRQVMKGHYEHSSQFFTAGNAEFAEQRESDSRNSEVK